jgi:hypothetical protein
MHYDTLRERIAESAPRAAALYRTYLEASPQGSRRS